MSTLMNKDFGEPGLSDDVVHLVQLTDCHLGPEKAFSLAGINTYETFSHVLSNVTASRASSLALITGDIACEGAEASYQLFSEMMTASQLNYRWLPGNHDDFEQMKKIIPQPFVKAQKLHAWVAISLVSAVTGRANGELSDIELQELSDLLKQHQHQFVLLFVHHPPVAIHCKWLDEQRISNSEKLNELIVRHGNVKAIFTGHVHQESVTDWCGIPVYSTPSTCFQFTRRSDTFNISGSQPPGYRWMELYPDGTLKTGIEHIACGEQHVDRSCIGY
ncbi:MAG: metallophosphoesterase [Porticoccus sp.]|nr:metallophosphoesterase [Porticoccus sp.]